MNSPSINTPNASPANPANSNPPQDFARPPSMRNFTPDPFDTPPPSNNKNLVIFGVAIGLGLMVFGIGFAFSGRSGASTTNPIMAAAPTPTIFDEQRQMMREALDMAKEAREAQRERAANMRKMMEEHVENERYR